MSEIVVMLILIGFVISGGIFIFLPDIKNIILKPKQKKRKKLKTKNIHEVYETHYIKEDAFLEAAKYVTGPHKIFSSIHEAQEKINHRGHLTQLMMENPAKHEHDCPICKFPNHVNCGEVQLTCRCNQGHYRAKAIQMMREMGHPIY